MTTTYSDILKQIYYNESNPESFGSIHNLYIAAKKQIPDLKLETVKDWLSGELTYTLHKPARQNWKRQPILVTGPNEQYQADLVDL